MFDNLKKIILILNIAYTYSHTYTYMHVHMCKYVLGTSLFDVSTPSRQAWNPTEASEHRKIVEPWNSSPGLLNILNPTPNSIRVHDKHYYHQIILYLKHFLFIFHHYFILFTPYFPFLYLFSYNLISTMVKYQNTIRRWLRNRGKNIFLRPVNSKKINLFQIQKNFYCTQHNKRTNN